MIQKMKKQQFWKAKKNEAANGNSRLGKIRKTLRINEKKTGNEAA